MVVWVCARAAAVRAMSRIAFASGRFMRGPLAAREGARLSTSILPVTMAYAVPVQNPLQVLPSVGAFYFRDRFGRADSHEISTAIAAFRTALDDPVGGLDHFKIVLDDDDRPSRIDQTAESEKELADIVEMQAGSGLIENIKHAAFAFGPVTALAEAVGRAGSRLKVRRQLHTLRFASR